MEGKSRDEKIPMGEVAKKGMKRVRKEVRKERNE